MTNGDRIRQKSNEELVEIILGSGCASCHYLLMDNCDTLRCDKGILLWLEKEVD